MSNSKQRHRGAIFALVLISALPAPAEEGAWDDVDPMPVANAEHGVAVVDGLIYTVGGFLNEGSSLWIHDPRSGEWTRGADLPFPTHHAGVATVNGRIYVIGGTAFETSTVLIYDPATDEWTRGADMPTPRTAVGVAVVAGKIHVIGGSEDILWGIAKRAHEVYDPATDTWEGRAPLPRKTEHAFAGAVGGRIYVVCGRDRLSAMNTTQIYDPETDSWTMGASAPRVTSGFGAAVFRNRIYLYGGEHIRDRMVMANLQRYDPARDSWELLDPAPRALHAIGTGVYENHIYFLGGEATVARADGINLVQRLTFPPAADTRLPAPSDLEATVRSRTKVRLRWKDNSDTETSFLVQVKRKGKKFKKVATLSPDVERVTIGDLVPGETYVFRIRAREGKKKSSYSNKAAATLPE